MSDTPTTAEEAEYAVYDRFGLIRDQMSRATAVDQLRFLEEKYPNDGPHRICRLVECDENGAPTPDALADLNGGEWVQPNNGFHSAWWHDTEPSDEDPPSAVWRCEGFPVNAPPNDNPPPGYRPMFVFVPRKATNG